MKEGSPCVLAVDDDDNSLFVLEQTLLANGFRVLTAGCGTEALAAAAAENPDLILCDVNMPGMDGFAVAAALKQDELLRFIPVILLTAKDSIEDITHGLERGADDYIRKPFEPPELIARLRAALRTRKIYRELQETVAANRRLQRQVSDRFQFASILGRSPAMQELFVLIEKVAASQVPVLITGESGTGKELVASAIHFNSQRKDKPLIVQNCSAFNENLLESELFGHMRGAFTGAAADRRGLFEEADGGTFFLDEVGEMSPALQAKLLRVLQDGTFIPVGGTKAQKVDVRIVAATNRDLKAMIARQEFREDLYYRLNVVNIEIPPLRERRMDIPLLIEHFLKKHSGPRGLSGLTISEEARRALIDYHWPGNIRELQNEIQRMIVMAGSDRQIGLDLVAPHIRSGKAGAACGGEGSGSLREAVENLERNMLLAALSQCGWNKSQAAKALGISRSTLLAKIETYGLKE